MGFETKRRRDPRPPRWERPFALLPSRPQGATWLREVRLVLLVSLLGGIILGAGISLSLLGDFSSMPGAFGMIMAVVTGAFIGMLIPHFHQGLVSVLLVALIGAGVSSLALAYPEFEVNRLGLDLALELSVLRSVTHSFLALPFLLIGLLIGKLLARRV